MLEVILIVLGSITGFCIAITGFMKIFPEFIKNIQEICSCCCIHYPYKIRLSNNKTGEIRYLDINIHDKKSVIVWSRDYKGGQDWLFENVNSNQFRLSNSRWGEQLYLDRDKNKIDVIVSPKDDMGGQLWEFEKVQDLENTYRIFNTRWGIKKYLDINIDVGVRVSEQNLGGGQLWKKYNLYSKQ
tara:strand:+ start:8405 stop:8959 length:555 start_codon:yes stop_codon:yes gene_type:complete